MTTARLDDKFDKDPVGSAPSNYPPPSPPNDVLSYTVTQQTVSVVVADPSGGGMVRITPTSDFFIAPDNRKQAMTIATDQFTTMPPANIRGHLKLRLDGTTGIVIIGLQASQSGNFIGGFHVGNYPVGIPGQAVLLNEFSLAQLQSGAPLSNAGSMATFPHGKVLDINWSIDQPSKNLAASVSGGPSQTTTFGALSGGIATTPIQKLVIWVWLEKPSSGTAVFLDNLYVEEYK